MKTKKFKYGDNWAEEVILRGAVKLYRICQKLRNAISILRLIDWLIILGYTAMGIGLSFLLFIDNPKSMVTNLNSDTSLSKTSTSVEGSMEAKATESSVDESESESEPITKSFLEQIALKNSLDYADLRDLCYLAICESVGDGYDSTIGIMYVAVNAANEWHDGNLYEEIHNHNRYECVDSQDSTIFNSYYGPVDDAVVLRDDCKWVISCAVDVLTGQAEDPTGGALYYQAYEEFGYIDSPEEFAKVHNIENYVVLGTHIFFKEWTNELNAVISKADEESYEDDEEFEYYSEDNYYDE